MLTRIAPEEDARSVVGMENYQCSQRLAMCSWSCRVSMKARPGQKKIHPSTQGVDQQPISNYRLEGILESKCDAQIFFESGITNDLRFNGKGRSDIFIELISNIGFNSAYIFAWNS